MSKRIHDLPGYGRKDTDEDQMCQVCGEFIAMHTHKRKRVCEACYDEACTYEAEQAEAKIIERHWG